MPPTLPALCALLALGATPVDTRFAQVAPEPRDGVSTRSAGQDRAVVLIHGLRFKPFNREVAVKAVFAEWQKPESLLVKQLARDSDVFCFAYAQTAAADEVADEPDLAADLRRVRRHGYRELVLVGHSAGGLIARKLVEDEPDHGVTKVIQVCAPNAGSGWAHWSVFFRHEQLGFLGSLTKEERRRALGARMGKLIPQGVEFVCVVGTGTVVGDGLVAARSQWTEDLQRQGVPAFGINASHWTVLRGKKGVELVANLVRESQHRWEPATIEAARRQLFGPFGGGGSRLGLIPVAEPALRK